jgi:hypothetical protein
MTPKRIDMKRQKMLIAVSVTLNIVLAGLLFFVGRTKKDAGIEPVKTSLHMNLADNDNFKKIFIEKNDSLYEVFYNKYFEDFPTQGYLLACAYYLIKKNDKTRKDIVMINSEIKAIYGDTAVIKFPGE